LLKACQINIFSNIGCLILAAVQILPTTVTYRRVPPHPQAFK